MTNVKYDIYLTGHCLRNRKRRPTFYCLSTRCNRATLGLLCRHHVITADTPKPIAKGTLCPHVLIDLNGNHKRRFPVIISWRWLHTTAYPINRLLFSMHTLDVVIKERPIHQVIENSRLTSWSGGRSAACSSCSAVAPRRTNFTHTAVRLLLDPAADDDDGLLLKTAKYRLIEST